MKAIEVLHIVVRAGGAVLLSVAFAASAGATVRENDRAARLYEDALTRFEKDDVAGAIIQLKNALQIDKSILQVHVLLGKALLAQGNAAAAEASFEEALRLGVNRLEVVVPLARAVLSQGRPADLLEQARFAGTGLPAAVQADLLLIKASAARETGDLPGAMQFIEAARAAGPAGVDVWLAEVPIRLQARQWAAATAAADKALMMAPGSAEALYLRGTVAHAQADLPSALGFYDRALKIEPSHPEALVSRAGLLIDQGRWKDASRDVAALRESSRNDPRGAYLSALLAEQRGDAAAARAALGDVTSLLDAVPMAFIRFRPQMLILGGLAHHGLGQREKARPYLEAAQRGGANVMVSKLLAQIYLADGDVDRAANALQAYLARQPDDVQALLLLGSVYMAQGLHGRATSLMQDALSRQDLPALRGMLGFGLVGGGDFAQAVKEFERALERDPGNVQAGGALASMLLQGGQPARALRVAEGLVERKPDHAGLLNLLGSARMRTGDAAGAAQAFERAARIDPDFAAPQVNLARLDVDRGAYDAALTRLSAVLAKNDKDLEALMEMGRLHARRGAPQDARRWLAKADEHAGPHRLQAALALVEFELAQRRPDLASEAVKRATDRAPDAVPVQMALARVLLANKDGAGAKTVLKRAMTRAGYDSTMLLAVARLQILAGDVAGAAYALDKALQERPDHVAAQVLRSDVAIRQGDLDNAEQRARRLVSAQPRLGDGHALLGDVAWRRNQRAAAVAAYRRAHTLEQSSVSVLRLYRALGADDVRAALRLAEEWLQSRPQDLAVRRALADGQARAGDLTAARASYETLIATAPRDAEVLNNLAHVLLLEKDAGALAVAERALAIAPEVPHIIGTVGWAAFKAGQSDRALQLLRDARLRDPTNPDTRYFLGAVLADKGRTREAREELQAALQTQTGFAHAEQARQLLTALK